MLLYWFTRSARVACATASATGADPARLLKAWPTPAAVPPIVPIVDEAASLVVVIVIRLVELSNVANRLLAASWVLRSFRLLTVPPVPSPKVMLVAVPLPVAPIVRVRPFSGATPAAPVSLVAVTPDEPVTVPAVVTAEVAMLEVGPVVVDVNVNAPAVTVA